MQRAVVESVVASPRRLLFFAGTEPSPSTRRVLIVGTSALGRATAEELRARHGCHCVIGFLSWEGDPTSRPLIGPLLGSWEHLAACLAHHPVDEVYLAATAKHHGDALDAVVASCDRMGIPFAVPAVAFRLTRGQARGTRGFADGYIHFAVAPRSPLTTMRQIARDFGARAVAVCAMLPATLLVRMAKLLTISPRLAHTGRALTGALDR